MCSSDLALINLQKLLKAIKEHQTEGILQRFPKILKWGYAPRFGEPSGSRSLPLTGRQSQSPRASHDLMKFQALREPIRLTVLNNLISVSLVSAFYSVRAR